MPVKKEKKRRRTRCESCRELKHGVEKMEDPYTKELEGRSVVLRMCPECYENSLMDI